MSTIRLVLAQINPLMGAIEQNRDSIIAAIKESLSQLQANIIVFPELAISGYPPEDLLYRPEFHQRIQAALQDIQQASQDCCVIIGHPCEAAGVMHNAASVFIDSNLTTRYYKQHLPNYSVFDEKRYFTPGDSACVFEYMGQKLGLLICEDLWQAGPMQQAVTAGAQAIISINASPFHLKKANQREAALQSRQQQEGQIPLIYVNCVGGQDELIFDGSSVVLDADQNITHRAPRFSEELFIVELAKQADGKLQPLPGEIAAIESIEAILYKALVLGTHDYIKKNGFHGAIIGVSGGIDSTLTLCIAADAIGHENVQAVLLPSRYTAQMSIEDGIELAENLGVSHSTISIEGPFQALLHGLQDQFAGLPPDVTEENIQARCRGTMLMAISNKTGKIVLATGNKSEMAVGYATLYGDMCGGYAVLKDVLKTMVYKLSRYRNTLSPVIPERCISRPPSAELAFGQTDQDTLPPYDQLDEIIVRYVEQDQGLEQIVAAGHDREMVKQILRLIEANEYKRRQAAPGIRLTARAFGRDWRYPITCKFNRG